MDVYNNRLAAIYRRLCATQLVQTKTASKDNIFDFATELNVVHPVQPWEEGVFDFGRWLAADIYTFLTIIEKKNMPHLILLSSGDSIAEHFGLTEVVTIRWNPEYKRFLVASVTPLSKALDSVNNERPLYSSGNITTGHDSQYPRNNDFRPQNHQRNDRSNNRNDRISSNNRWSPNINDSNNRNDKTNNYNNQRNYRNDFNDKTNNSTKGNKPSGNQRDKSKYDRNLERNKERKGQKDRNDTRVMTNAKSTPEHFPPLSTEQCIDILNDVQGAKPKPQGSYAAVASNHPIMTDLIPRSEIRDDEDIIRKFREGGISWSEEPNTADK